MYTFNVEQMSVTKLNLYFLCKLNLRASNRRIKNCVMKNFPVCSSPTTFDTEMRWAGQAARIRGHKLCTTFPSANHLRASGACRRLMLELILNKLLQESHVLYMQLLIKGVTWLHQTCPVIKWTRVSADGGPASDME
jgi:hypothetical protein